jgi:hypothetical protein
VNLDEARNAVWPSTMANRRRELHGQSMTYQAKMAQVASEIEVLQEKIATLGTPERRENREETA